ncbi:hypothetical protein E2C01_036745 [Portunus trituberculatus]|uniref:Uncharacterized protein n=1 Tax=Portunus trituberculatus TaxID=210409 RepID=A0A5B7FDH6_PORTR|nr:hypothetical protein [Portunus trituberculatus]
MNFYLASALKARRQGAYFGPVGVTRRRQSLQCFPPTEEVPARAAGRRDGEAAWGMTIRSEHERTTMNVPNFSITDHDRRKHSERQIKIIHEAM